MNLILKCILMVHIDVACYHQYLMEELRVEELCVEELRETKKKSCCIYKDNKHLLVKEVRDVAAENGHVKCYINTFETIPEMLLHAAQIGNIDAIRFALDIRFFASYVYENSFDMRHICIRYNQIECLRFLISETGEIPLALDGNVQ